MNGAFGCSSSIVLLTAQELDEAVQQSCSAQHSLAVTTSRVPRHAVHRSNNTTLPPVVVLAYCAQLPSEERSGAGPRDSSSAADRCPSKSLLVLTIDYEVLTLSVAPRVATAALPRTCRHYLHLNMALSLHGSFILYSLVHPPYCHDRHSRCGCTSSRATTLHLAKTFQCIMPAISPPLSRESRLSMSRSQSDPLQRQTDTDDRRLEYYVARYEVVAAVSDNIIDVEQPRYGGRRLASPPLLPPHTSLHGSTLLSPAPSSATSPRSMSLSSAASTTSLSSSSSFSTSSDSGSRSLEAASSFPARSTTPTPPHIAHLRSAWRTTPSFIDSVTDLTILGEGSSGVVYRGTYGDANCVVKLPKAVSLTGAAWREWQCHLTLPPHPNLVRFLGALPMSTQNYLVLSFVRQGSLHSLLTSPTLSSAWYRRPYGVMRCVRDMAAVLQHIHSCHIVHRDVSCRNILVDSDGSMVLADLGLAVQLPAADHSHESDADTAVPVRWTSPESLASPQQYSSKSDVWSLGVALWEMTAGGRLPFGDHYRKTRDCIRPIAAGQLTLQVDDEWGSTDIDEHSSSLAEWKLAGRVRQLIELCLTYEVEQRPDSGQLKRLVERLWEEWREEVGEVAANVLESEWAEYHNGVQQRLGSPTEARGITAAAATAWGQGNILWFGQ